MKKIMPSDCGAQLREDLRKCPGNNSHAGAKGTRKEASRGPPLLRNEHKRLLSLY